MKNKKTKFKVDSKVYFNDIKRKAEIQLFNLEHSGINSLDPNIIKMALKNLVFYTDKKLEKLNAKSEKDNNV